MKILVIEDDTDLKEIVCRSLQAERHVTEWAGTVAEARMRVQNYQYDCVLLDIMLPDGSGLSVLPLLPRGEERPAVIILSAKDAIEDKVAGLELGADDYLAKPFHLAELHARIKCVRRRHHGGERSLSVGNVRLWPDDFRLEVAGKAVELSRREFDILSYMLQRPSRLVDKQALAEGVWGDYMDVADSYDFVYAQMKNLRKRLKTSGADIEVRTVYGVGYKLQLIDTPQP